MEKTLRWMALAVALALVGCAQPTEDKKTFTVSGTVSYASWATFGYTLEVYPAGSLDAEGYLNPGAKAPLVTRVLTEELAKVVEANQLVPFTVSGVAEGTYDIRVVIPTISNYPCWFLRNLSVNQDRALGVLSLGYPPLG